MEWLKDKKNGKCYLPYKINKYGEVKLGPHHVTDLYPVFKSNYFEVELDIKPIFSFGQSIINPDDSGKSKATIEQIMYSEKYGVEYELHKKGNDWYSPLVSEKEILKYNPQNGNASTTKAEKKSDTSLLKKEVDLLTSQAWDATDFKVGDWAHNVKISEPYYITQVINVDDKKITLSDVLFGKNKKVIPNIENRWELAKYDFEATPKFKIGDKVVGISNNYKDIKQTLNIVGYYALPKTHEIMYQCIGNMDKDEHKCREYEIELWKHDYEPNSKFNKIASKATDNFKVGDWVTLDNDETKCYKITKLGKSGPEFSDGFSHDYTTMKKVESLSDIAEPKYKAGSTISNSKIQEGIKKWLCDGYYINLKTFKYCYRVDHERARSQYVIEGEQIKHTAAGEAKRYEQSLKDNEIPDYAKQLYRDFDIDPEDDFYSQFLGAITEEGADGLLQATNYDTKHKLNLAPDKKIPESVVEDLRKEGLTIEKIDALAKDGYPVCKYKTQVTIHGICPTLKSNRSAGGYVTLVVNDNKSLGVRWRAIDEKKKYDIVRILGWFGYRYKEDSQNFVITRSIPALRNPKDQHSNMSHEEEEAKYKELQATFQKLIDNNLFFGEVRIGKPTHSWFTSNYFHVVINIDGIYEKNIKPFIETILGMKYSDVEKEIERLKKEAEEEEKAEEEQRKKEAAERAKKQAEQIAEIERQRALLPFPPEFKKVEELKKDDIIVSWNTIFHPEIKVLLNYRKVYSAYGKLRCYSCDENGVVTDKSGHDIPAKQKDNAWYVKRATAQAKPQREVKDVAIDNSEATDFKILRYSDKAYILTGNTKPYAAILGRKGGMGLKWGTYWRNSQYDPIPDATGWMFGEQMKPKVEEFIAKYQKSGSEPEKPEVSEILIHELNLLK